MTSNLKIFISKANKNTFFLTSRPDNALSSFGNFLKFDIMNLTPDEAYSLFEKYDLKTGFNLAPMLTTQIIDSLKSESFLDLKSFLGNPLLVSFIYITYKHKRNIPTNKDDFYRKVYDALYEDHDYSKDGFNRKKHCNLSKETFHKFLRKLGFVCLIDNNNDYSKDKLIKLIDSAKDTTYIDKVDSSNIFKDLLETVPLFSKDGLSYKWSHKSFMEYFSACYIFMDVSTKKEEVLKQIFTSENFDIYENLLNIYYDLDQETFDSVIVLPILSDYLTYIGDTKRISKLKIEFKKAVYNKIYYASDSWMRKRIPDPDEIMKKTHNDIYDYAKNLQNEKLHNLSLRVSMKSDESNGIFIDSILSPRPNISKVLRILRQKQTPLVKEIEEIAPLKKINRPRIVSYLDDIKFENDTSIRDKYKFMLNFPFLFDNFVIDIAEAIKQKQRIEEYIQAKQRDVISII